MQRPIIGSPKRKGIGQTGMHMLQTTWHQEIDRIPMRWAIGVVNELCDRRDRVVAAAGGLPAEVTANWRTLERGTVDVEFGFSCMGYEISGAWGARIGPSPNANRIRIRSYLSATRLLHDAQFGHLFVGSQSEKADHPGAGQWRVCCNQQTAEQYRQMKASTI